MLELSGLFVCLGGLIKFFSAWGGGGGNKNGGGGGFVGDGWEGGEKKKKKIAGLWFARGIIIQTDTV